MAQQFVNCFLKKHLNIFNEFDRMFVRQVLNDIGKFVYNEDHLKDRMVLLTFPPLNSHYRYIVHRIATVLGLKTICVGEGKHRIIMIGQHASIPTLERTEQSISQRCGNGAIKKVYNPLPEKAEHQIPQKVGNGAIKKIMKPVDQNNEPCTSSSCNSCIDSSNTKEESRWFKDGQLKFREFKPFS